MKEINIESIVGNNNINIIDIRDNYLYNMGCIPGSRNIPMNFLITNPDNYLNKEEEYYIYCIRGINSKRTCEILTRLGYNVVNLIGGFERYKLLFDKQ